MVLQKGASMLKKDGRETVFIKETGNKYCFKEKVRKYVNALLNSHGGVIYFGVSLNGTIVGFYCTRKEEDELRLCVDHTLGSYTPFVSASLYRLTFLDLYEDNKKSDHRIIELKVSVGQVGEIYEDGQNQVYIIDESLIIGPLYPQELKELILLKYKECIEGAEEAMKFTTPNLAAARVSARTSKMHRTKLVTPFVLKMPRNVEIKAKINDIVSFKELVVSICTEPGIIIPQHDTFFNTQNGRLKLRVTPYIKELIYYERSDAEGPKLSNYVKHNPDDDVGLKEVLKQAYGIRGTVEKTRTLYMCGQTRIHVDEVVGLGNFMELEVVLRDEQTLDEGDAIARDLMRKLNINELLSGAYIDMLETK